MQGLLSPEHGILFFCANPVKTSRGKLKILSFRGVIVLADVIFYRDDFHNSWVILCWSVYYYKQSPRTQSAMDVSRPFDILSSFLSHTNRPSGTYNWLIAFMTRKQLQSLHVYYVKCTLKLLARDSIWFLWDQDSRRHTLINMTFYNKVAPNA